MSRGADFERRERTFLKKKIRERREKGEVLVRIAKKRGRMRGKEEV